MEDEELKIINEKRMKKLQQIMNEKELLKNIKDPLNLDDSNFFQTISKFPLLLVDFWAPWCGPCRMMSPLIDQIGKEYMGNLVVGKVNVDENPTISRQFGISSIPTLILFKKGQAVNKIIGSVSKNKIDEMVRMHLE
ncbi:MAG: thioredoxin [Nitrososphaeraceae archaeon]|nr:thioredoxin [Nitrososphaeraceae archaeon]MDW0139689.1 thioredoxin [Nitrososphaeraceae archaeon]MDW0142487.1 thioredoxin [Nitrososphaeraceae archaeon]MDW0148260.1 thioredoxin [Nitrososphaeraceae archaeon]MDW0151132.1 thioredoxin [Nitrososphaeraceae archaeon]